MTLRDVRLNADDTDAPELIRADLAVFAVRRDDRADDETREKALFQRCGVVFGNHVRCALASHAVRNRR